MALQKTIPDKLNQRENRAETSVLRRRFSKLMNHSWTRPIGRGGLIVAGVCALSWFGATAASSSPGPDESVDPEVHEQFHKARSDDLSQTGNKTISSLLDKRADVPISQEKDATEPVKLHDKPTSLTNQAPGILPDGRVVLNTASAEQLCRLPSIGLSRAQKIVALREKLRGFRTVRQLLRIRGIGPRTIKKLTPLVVIDPPQQTQKASESASETKDKKNGN